MQENFKIKEKFSKNKLFDFKIWLSLKDGIPADFLMIFHHGILIKNQ
jgi:hypothetical protein